jgi:hypothetical protein
MSAVLIEKPEEFIIANVPMIDTGIAIIGISVARDDCKNTEDRDKHPDARFNKRLLMRSSSDAARTSWCRPSDRVINIWRKLLLEPLHFGARFQMTSNPFCHSATDKCRPSRLIHR